VLGPSGTALPQLVVGRTEIRLADDGNLSTGRTSPACVNGRTRMIILGVILLIVGFIAAIPILWTIGIILVVIGAIFALLGATGRAVGGRKMWY
jgi:hypothetical protein